MDSLLRDARFGARMLLRNPGFAAVAILTLALGIGVTSAVFSVQNGLIFSYLPFENADRAVRLDEVTQDREDWRGVSSAEYLDWKEHARSFEGLLAFRWADFNFTDLEDGRRVNGFQVTPDALALLGIELAAGRGFLPEDAAPGAEPTVVISHDLWVSHFRGDPGAIGSRAEINGDPATLVGVLGEGQWFLMTTMDALSPLSLEGDAASRAEHDLGVIGVLKPGVALERAQAEMDVIHARLAEDDPEANAGWIVRAQSEREASFEPGKGAIAASSVLVVAAVFVLLIACVNLANLLLVRAAARQKEIATRAALGASRGQLLAQLLTESAVLALCALPLALLLTRWCLAFFMTQVNPLDVRIWAKFLRVDPPVILFAALLCFATVLLFGVAPALHASRPDLNEALKEGGGRGSSSAGHKRLRSALVVVQIALALALLVPSALLIRRFGELWERGLGFELEGLATTNVHLPDESYPRPELWLEFHRTLLERLRENPRIQSVATVTGWPFNVGRTSDVRIEGEGNESEAAASDVGRIGVSDGYFATIGLPLREGRAFEATDREGAAPVIVVSQSLASQLFPEKSPIGKRLLFDEEAHEIVGVVADDLNPRGGPSLRIYQPFEQEPWTFIRIIARTAGGFAFFGPAVASEVKAIDSRLRVGTIYTLEEMLHFVTIYHRFSALLMSTLGGLALLLAAVGIYGVLSYSTAQRSRELAIRIAVGAEPWRVAGLVLRQASLLAGIGTGIGLALGLVISRGLGSQLYAVDSWEPTTVLATCGLLVFVILGAVARPVWRASRVDPMLILRTE